MMNNQMTHKHAGRAALFWGLDKFLYLIAHWTTLYAFFLFFSSSIIAMQPAGKLLDAATKAVAAGAESLQPAGKFLGSAAKDAVAGAASFLATTNSTTLLVVKPILENVGVDAGANVGLNTVMYIEGSVKAAAGTVIASPVTRSLVAMVVVSGASYVVYKIYRHKHPTIEVQVLKEEAEAGLIEAKVRTCEAKIALVKKEQEFHVLQPRP